MRVEQIVFPLIRQVARRPRLAKVIFGLVRTDNPFDPAAYADPYPAFERFRAKGPVFYHRVFGQWLVTGYDEAQEVARSTGTTVRSELDVLLSVRPYTKLSAKAKTSVASWVLLTDPPDHTRLRGLVSRAFTPRQIASSEPVVKRVARDLIEAMKDTSEVDVVAGFTSKLPIYVIADLLGLPRDRWDWLKETSDAIAGLLDPILGFDPVEVNRHFDDVDRYFRALAAERRVSPTDDLISALVRAADNDALSDDELVAMMEILMIAGHETTTGLLGNSIVALAANPEQRTLFRDQPELRDNAVEELIRYDTSVLTGLRTATTEVTVGGKTIKSGARVGLVWAAANRDPRRWPDANELRLNRENPQPISFGHGIHHCIGAALARLEMRVGLSEFVDAFGDYSVDLPSIQWKASGALRGPTFLPVGREATASTCVRCA